LATLECVLQKFGQVTVVAPNGPHSGCGHRVTDATPISVVPVSDSRYAIDGTPADCTRLGVLHLAEDADWVVAGINAGGNLGIDMFMSGTVAAVREAALLGHRAVAISQYFPPSPSVNWEHAAGMTERLLRELWQRPLERGAFWNVNLPVIQAASREPEIVFCQPDFSRLHVEYEQRENVFRYRGDYGRRGRRPGHDVDVCFSGHIAVSKIIIYAADDE
jgi:5'-nucleotidase